MRILSSRHRWRLPAFTLLFGLILCGGLLASCRKKQPATARPKQYAYEKTYTQDGATVRLQLDRQSLNVAEHAKLVVTASGPEQWPSMVTAPPSNPQGLSLREMDRQGPRLLDADRIQTRIVYRLRPFLPGEEEIGAFKVHFARPKGELTITTRPVSLTIASLLPKKKAATLNDIAPPMALANYLPLYLAAGGLLLVLLLFVCWRLLRKAKKAKPAPPTPPHQVAHQALDRLLASGLLDQGELAAFFKKLSDILRRYIEDRFSVRAPEQTTEEFLQAMTATSSFRPTDRTLLQDFLTHCDLIKFARLEPTVQEGRDRLQLCRRFIDETAYFAGDLDGSGGQP